MQCPIAATEFQLFSNVRTTINRSTTPGALILTSPIAQTASCTLQLPLRMPVFLFDRQVQVTGVFFYFSGLSSNAYITRNFLYDYDVEDGTKTDIDDDTSDITSGTSHGCSNLPYVLDINEYNSAIILELDIVLAANSSLTLTGVLYTYNTQTA